MQQNIVKYEYLDKTLTIYQLKAFAMKTNFICPKCRGYLNVDKKVIFTVKKKGWSGGIVKLSPELGDYAITHHPSFKFDDGDHFEFHCPICNYDLTLDGADKLAKVILHEEDGKEYFVVFSKIKGERCTYKISEKQVEESYGDHAGRNMDLLSATFFR
jgi:uncharacterized protein YbaR (Trm112 family)